MTPEEAEERSAFAGEYVLGTLDAAERAAFERALPHDAALQAEVYFWQDRLLGLAARVAPQQPDAALWPAIERAVAGRAGVAPPAGTPAPAANDALGRRLRRWQWTGGLALAAAALLATVLAVRTIVPGDAPARYLAVLQAPDDRSTGWIVEITRGERVRLIPVGPMAAVPAGRSVQFWTKPDGAAGPTSLGLVDPGRTTELPAARLPALGEKQLFELTLEAPGGSPTAKPTGPILFVGRTVRL